MRDLDRYLVVLLASALAACGGDGTSADDAGPGVDAAHFDAGPVPDATFVELPEAPPTPPPQGVTPTVGLYTYNTGLIDDLLVKAPEERRPLIVAAVKAADADVICLQELYASYGGPERMAADLKDVYPYATWRWRNPTSDTQLGNGLLIASKHPLYRARSLEYQAVEGTTVVDRGVMAADVLTPDAYFTVMCTHLQAGLKASQVTIKGEEVSEAVAFARAEGYLDDGHITMWLGDFNSGPDPTDPSSCPANPDCCVAPECTEAPDTATYELVKSMGFTDPNTDALGSTSGRKVYIPLQVLNIYNKEPSGRIDHCFYRGLPGVDFGGGSIVFDEDPMIAYSGPGSPQGGEVLHTLSDHLGLRCGWRPDEPQGVTSGPAPRPRFRGRR
jgi:endonuclease/exonuclease/phosphatase family metal-dependent hydrolase